MKECVCCWGLRGGEYTQGEAEGVGVYGVHRVRVRG